MPELFKVGERIVITIEGKLVEGYYTGRVMQNGEWLVAIDIEGITFFKNESLFRKPPKKVSLYRS